MREATREEILEFIKHPLITIDYRDVEFEKWYTEEEGKFILENYILKYKTFIKLNHITITKSNIFQETIYLIGGFFIFVSIHNLNS